MDAKLSKSSTSKSKFLPDHSSQSLPSSSQCAPIFIEYQLMKEFVLFQRQEFLHVYISPSHQSAFEWFGVMFIHQGLYKGKILRFSMHISPSYPNGDIPKIIFDPIPQHPLVNTYTGELNVTAKFTKWNSTCNFLFQIIAFAKNVFDINHIENLKEIIAAPKEFPYDNDCLKKMIKEKMDNFNEQVISKKIDDRNFIDFIEPENHSSVIGKLRQKLLTEKFSSDPILNYSNSNDSMSNNRNYCSTSISGLSWTKKIVYN